MMLSDFAGATTGDLASLTIDCFGHRTGPLVRLEKKDQLVSKKILPQATYDGIKGLIIAKQK